MSATALVFTNANVITMWPARPRVREVVIQGERFLDVGDDLGRPRGARVLDLRGRTLLPGFIDSHAHLLDVGLAGRSADLAGTASLAEALGRVAARAASTPKDALLRAPGWDESIWPERRLLTRADLDAVAPHHLVVAPRVCGHLVVVNSQALTAVRRASGLDDAALAAAGADPDAGILRHGTSHYAHCLAEPDEAERREALAEACQCALALGITTVHDLSDDGGLYAALRAAGRLPLRAYVATHPTEHGAIPPRVLGASDEWLWLGPVKVFADGSFGARTAALNEPYADLPGSTGELYSDLDRLTGLVARAHGLGRQVACHAIGDRGIETALAAFERVLSENPRWNHRHRLEHAELLRPQAIAALKRLRLIASVQPNFTGRWGRAGGLYERRLGRRVARVNPFRTLSLAGVPMAFGSDGMPLGPLYGIWSAVTHTVSRQRLTAEEAIRCATVGGAFAAFAEDRIGCVAPGFLADAVILADDPTAVAAEVVKDIGVVATLVGGEVVSGAL